MRFCSGLATAPCGSPRAINVATLIRRVSASWVPGRLQGVGNAPLPLPTHAPTAPGGELADVVHAISIQLLEWGASICYHQAARLLQQQVPGMRLPLELFEAVVLLHATAREDLLRTAQAAVAAAAARGAIIDGLAASPYAQEVAYIQRLAPSPAALLGLAFCAMLYAQLRGSTAARPQSMWGKATLRLFGALRLISTLISTPASAGRIAETGHSNIPSPLLPLTERLLGATFPNVSALGGGDADAALSNPLIFGAEARGGQRKAARHKIVVNAGGAAGGHGKAKTPGGGHRRVLAARVAEGGRRDTFSAPDGAGPVYPAGSKKDSKKKKHTAEDDAASAEKQKPSSNDSSRPRPAARPAQTNGADAGALATPAPEGSLDTRACVRFDKLQRTRMQLAKLPLLEDSRSDTLFCVHARAASMFEGMLPVSSTRPGDIVAFFALAEPPADVQEDTRMRMYSGLGQLHDGVARTPRALGDYRIYRVATISILSDKVREQHAISDDRMLASDSFKAMRIAVPDAADRWLLPFHTRQVPAGGARMNFGFCNVETQDDGLAIRDDPFMLSVSRRGIGDLATVLEARSGLRYDARQDASRPLTYWDVQPISARHLFVRWEALPAIGVDRTVGLLPRSSFDAVTVDVDGNRQTRHGTLYRMSFSVMGEQLFYVDQHGRRGTLQPGPADSGRSGLWAPPGAEADFIKAHGLGGIDLAEATRILENYGFARMPLAAPAAVPQRVPAALHGIRIERIADDLPPAVASWDGRSGLFEIDRHNHVVRYVGHDGAAGQMAFDSVRHHPDGCVVLADNTLSDLLFAHRIGVFEHFEHSWHAIQEALHGAGFIDGAP